MRNMSTARMQLDVRNHERRDEAAILALLHASLGWVPDEMFASFFDWKHRQSPFGESPGWVAVDGDRVVGFRTYMRWEFLHNGRIRRAVRAVDTATHPEYQGQGIFWKLTRASLEDLLEDGVDFVFNTPNDKSRPGYLKMGWREVGRVPVAVRLRAPASAGRVARARVPADKWSASCSAGQPAPEVLSDHTAIGTLLASRAPTSGMTTRRTCATARCAPAMTSQTAS
jgi:GNAT superfamily N-acetyltransferase